MKTLVLNVDRDDDFGRKTNTKSPIIGIKDNINAANRLGQADPEDSDLNAIFSAISTYKQLKRENKDVEIATICGDINVGSKSDTVLSQQLDEVIKKTQADEVIFITDGAEDEFIIPMIQSRIKINYIKRVTVKQTKDLEDTYYRIMKMLDDEKVQKQILLPIALVLLVWAVFILLNMTSAALGATLFTLGVYLLIRIFHLERNVVRLGREIKSGFLTGRLSIYTYIIAIVVIVISGFFAYNNTEFNTDVAFIPFLSFLSNMIWGIVAAGLIAISGHAVDIYVREEKVPWKYWILPFSIITFGFISSAIFISLHRAFINGASHFTIEPFLTSTFIGYTTTGIMVAIVGGITYHYIKQVYTNEKEKPEKEEQKLEIAEKN
ncbi:MAG: DUF373 family protein [Candidatus Thermoplasmatota archaeon]|jgi:putative membrane protein|nr:DUF373 family protein [Candidatus Thermoplasmatota archaeon]